MEGYQKEMNGINIDRLTIVAFLLAATNIVAEFFVRIFLPYSFLAPTLNALQIIIFLVLPLALIFKSTPRVTIVLLLLVAVIPLLHNSYFMVLVFWSIFGALFYYQRKSCEQLGFIGKNFPINVVLGVLTALIVIAHMLATLYLVRHKIVLPLNPGVLLPKIIPGLAFGVLSMELFFRGFLFKRLRENNNISFLFAATASTVLYLLPFLTNPLYYASRGLFASAVYYVVFEGFLFCYLVERTKSLIPPAVASALILVFVNIIL